MHSARFYVHAFIEYNAHVELVSLKSNHCSTYIISVSSTFTPRSCSMSIPYYLSILWSHALGSLHLYPTITLYSENNLYYLPSHSIVGILTCICLCSLACKQEATLASEKAHLFKKAYAKSLYRWRWLSACNVVSGNRFFLWNLGGFERTIWEMEIQYSANKVVFSLLIRATSCLSNTTCTATCNVNGQISCIVPWVAPGDTVLQRRQLTELICV